MIGKILLTIKEYFVMLFSPIYTLIDHIRQKHHLKFSVIDDDDVFNSVQTLSYDENKLLSHRSKILLLLIVKYGCRCGICGAKSNALIANVKGKVIDGITYFSYTLSLRRLHYPTICDIDSFFNIYEEYTIDHIIPKSKGGTNTTENLQLACRSCNHKKSNSIYPNMIQQTQKNQKNIDHLGLELLGVVANNNELIYKR